MEKQKYKGILIYIITLVLSIVLIGASNQYLEKRGGEIVQQEADIVAKAEVTQVLEKVTEEAAMGGTNDYIEFVALILNGSMDGIEVRATQVNDMFMAVKMQEVAVGDRVLLYYTGDVNGDGGWVLGEYVRTDKLILLAIVFSVLLLLFGRTKGISTILSLALTCMAIFMVLIKAILAGENIYLWTLLVSSFIIIMTIVLVNGISDKSLVATIGCIGGVSVCAILTFAMQKILRMTGLIDEDSTYLMMLYQDKTIDLNAIIFAGIVIGAVGAIMDVAISMASSLYEVKEQSANPHFSTIMTSGINIGRDIMGTMANTLVLAYIGSSISIVLLLVAYSTSLMALFNREMIVAEILQALVGSFGLLMTIPLTSFCAAMVYTKEKKEEGNNQS